MQLTNQQTLPVGQAQAWEALNDIALLQLRGAQGLPVAPLGDSNLVALGQPVLTIGCGA